VSNAVVIALQDFMLEKDIPDDVRMEVLSRVDKAFSEEAAARSKERWRLTFQRTFLQVILLVTLTLLGTVWIRVIKVERVAMAKAYNILLQRLGIASETGLAAMDMALHQVGEWVKDVQGDKEASGQEKQLRLENLKRVGDALKNFRATYEAGYKEAKESAAKIPDEISPLTVVRDPITKMDLPLNATMGGVVDQKALKSFLSSQEWLVALLLTAKEASRPGTTALLPKYDANADQFSLNVEAMTAAGVKAPRGMKQQGNDIPPPPTNLPPIPDVPDVPTEMPGVQKK